MNKDNSPKVKLCPHCKQEVDPKASRCPHCQGKIYQWTLGKKIVAGFIGFIVLITIISSVSGSGSSSTSTATNTGSSSPSATSSHVKIGDNAYLRLPGAATGDITVLTSKAALDDFTKAAVNKDTYGMAELVENGEGFFVPQGTKILVIDGSFTASQVRILEGTQIGKSGWVPFEFVSAQ
jgi:RNA polymerase subunit RPABC4/transcription elongation factor Spt4